MPDPSFQNTLSKSASLAGTALHTGEKVTLTLHPAPPGFGRKFKRSDLPDEPTIDAKVENVKTVERSTTIAEGNVKVHTVEHVLSAFAGLEIDNAVVELDSNEPPIAVPLNSTPPNSFSTLKESPGPVPRPTFV